MPKSLNKRVGDYLLIHRIGDGAQGRIYCAQCTVDDKPHVPNGTKVALKILQLFSDDEHQRSSFKREVEILSKLSHPNIVAYLDSFVWTDELGDEYPCLVMEYLEGEDLKAYTRRRGGQVETQRKEEWRDRTEESTERDMEKWLRRKRHEYGNGLSFEEARGVFLQCLTGLAYARDQGVTHRDIKPSNIFIMPDDTVRVIDFGIARREDIGGTTTIGWRKGTDGYMEPRLVRGDAGFIGDELSDIFSLGVCFYEVLTGRLPFSTTREVGWKKYIDHIKNGPSFPSGIFGMLKGVIPLIRTSLQENPENRHESFKHMYEALAKCQYQSITTSTGESYTFRKYLGKGGFGRVFLAERSSDGCRFAVKQLSSKHDPSRFRREAKCLQEHPHPHIVKYEDFAEVEGLAGTHHYLVMELMEGMPEWSLRERIRAARGREEVGGLDFKEVQELFCVYLDALKFLHKGSRHKPEVIHRDITPSNLYAPPHEPHRAKIFDMGIAVSDDWTRLTIDRPPGNPEYMAPEFFLDAGFRGNVKSDIYSMGLCLYEAITGERAFSRLSKDRKEMWAELLRRAQKEVEINYNHLSLRQHPGLCGIIRNATAVSPGQRYRSAHHMLQALQSLVDESAEIVPTEATWLSDETRATMESSVFSTEAALPDVPFSRSINKRGASRRIVQRLLAASLILMLSILMALFWEIWGHEEWAVHRIDVLVDRSGQFEATASHVGSLRESLETVTRWQRVFPNNRTISKYGNSLEKDWGDLIASFDREFTESLDKKGEVSAHAIVRAWEESGEHLPFGDITADDHNSLTRSMKKRLDFMQRIGHTKPAISIKCLREIEESIRSLQECAANEEFEAAKNWWTTKQEQLDARVMKLPHLFQLEFDATLSQSPAAADELMSVWERDRVEDFPLLRKRMSNQYEICVRNVRHIVTGFLNELEAELQRAYDKAQLKDALSIHRALSGFKRDAPRLAKMCDQTYETILSRAASKQVSYLEGSISSVPTDLDTLVNQTNRVADQFRAIHGYHEEWRGGWNTAQNERIIRVGMNRCQAIADCLPYTGFSSSVLRAFDALVKAIPDEYGKKIIVDKLVLVRNVNSAIAEAVKALKNLDQRFSASTPEQWREGLTQWDMLRLGEDVRSSVMVKKEYARLFGVLETSIRGYLKNCATSTEVDQVGDFLATPQLKTLVGDSLIKSLKNEVVSRHSQIALVQTVEKARRDIRDLSEATATNGLSAEEAIHRLAKFKTDSWVDDKEVLRGWENGVRLCCTNLVLRLRKVEPIETRGNRLKELGSILNSSSYSTLLDNVRVENPPRKEYAVQIARFIIGVTNESGAEILVSIDGDKSRRIRENARERFVVKTTRRQVNLKCEIPDGGYVPYVATVNAVGGGGKEVRVPPPEPMNRQVEIAMPVKTVNPEDVRVAYRLVGGEKWSPVESVKKQAGQDVIYYGVALYPGRYEFIFSRLDYEDIIAKPTEVLAGGSELTISGPETSNWEPASHLVRLRNAETALDEDRKEDVIEAIAELSMKQFGCRKHAARFESLVNECHKALASKARATFAAGMRAFQKGEKEEYRHAASLFEQTASILGAMKEIGGKRPALALDYDRSIGLCRFNEAMSEFVAAEKVKNKLVAARALAKWAHKPGQEIANQAKSYLGLVSKHGASDSLPKIEEKFLKNDISSTSPLSLEL